VRIQAMGPSFDVQNDLLAKNVLTGQELRTHMKLHEGYAKRFNETPKTSESLHNWSGCLLHNLFWGGLEPGKGLPWSLTRAVGGEPDMNDIVPQLHKVALGIRGSGWACVSLTRPGDLVIHAVPNHEYPWEELNPLAVVDVWEHAFASRLTFRNGYLNDLIPLLNWNVALARLESARI